MDLKSEIVFKGPKKEKKESLCKVYTINNESRYLLIDNVPDLNLTNELIELFCKYGIIETWEKLDDPNQKEFTSSYFIKFADLSSAKLAKVQLDDSIFYGSPLWIIYAPQFESWEETRSKLLERINYIQNEIGSEEKLCLL